MQIRLPIPYATKTKGKKEIRIGVGTIDVREVSSVDAPIVARQTDSFLHSDDGDNSQVTDFRFLDGGFYVPYRRNTQNTRKYPFSTIKDIPDADRLEAHQSLSGWEMALDAVPFLPSMYRYVSLIGNVSLHYGRLIPDAMDDAPALLKSKSWDYVEKSVDDTILIEGAIYTKSIGPAFNIRLQEDGNVKVTARKAAYRALPEASTRMAWNRDDILAEFEGLVTEDALDNLIGFADGIDPSSLDTGYDPLPLALENMAWQVLNDAHSISNASDELIKVVLDLRKGLLECMPEAEGMFGPRFPANPRKWDTVVTEPEKAYGLMPLIDSYRAVHQINGFWTEEMTELKRSLDRVMSDETALSSAFG